MTQQEPQPRPVPPKSDLTDSRQTTPGSHARDYWAENLDPQNLEPPEGDRAVSLEDELAFAASPDIESARIWLSEGAPRQIVDLGAGLGFISMYLAGKEHHVVAVDSSISRLRELKKRSATLGLQDSIGSVVALAEALPFADESIDACFTRSVLIHTDVGKSAAEIHRSLTPGGRAALVEPQPGNPFAWLYRNTFAPKAWKTITRYFRSEEQGLCLDAIGKGQVRHFYLFSFLAFVFQFLWPRPSLFLPLVRVSNSIEQLLFTILPPIRRLAWFGVIQVRKDPPET